MSTFCRITLECEARCGSVWLLRALPYSVTLSARLDSTEWSDCGVESPFSDTSKSSTSASALASSSCVSSVHRKKPKQWSPMFSKSVLLRHFISLLRLSRMNILHFTFRIRSSFLNVSPPSSLFNISLFSSFSVDPNHRTLTSSNTIFRRQRKVLVQHHPHLTKRPAKQRCVFRSPAEERRVFNVREIVLCCGFHSSRQINRVQTVLFSFPPKREMRMVERESSFQV